MALPTGALYDAAAALDSARTALARAEDLDWVSTAAAGYRSELAVLHVRLRGLELAVERAQGQWRQARSAALRWGQL